MTTLSKSLDAIVLVEGEAINCDPSPDAEVSL